MRKSKRSKDCHFNKQTREKLFNRDGHCIFCGTVYSLTAAHYISRAKGGLGILQNGVTLCLKCHRKLDQSTMRPHLLKQVREYLDKLYPDFPDEDRYYKKWSEQ